MPIDDRPNLDTAREKFPNLFRAVDECDRTLKKLRRIRNRGFATDHDVEAARQARDLLLTILDKGHWLKFWEKDDES